MQHLFPQRARLLLLAVHSAIAIFSVSICASGVQASPDATAGTAASEAQSADRDVDFGPYMANLQRMIIRSWVPPKGHEKDRISVHFKIAKSGRLLESWVQSKEERLAEPILTPDKSSKKDTLTASDKAALAAVSRAAEHGFGVMPEGSPDKVDIQFTFDYSIYLRSLKLRAVH